MAQLIFNPKTGEGSCVVVDKATWALAHDATSADSITASNIAIATGATTYDINRIFIPFDTSTIGAGATVTGVTLQVYRDDTVRTFANGSTTVLHVIQTTQIDSTSLAVGDYDNITMTSGGSFTLASTSNGAYSTFTFNATGRGWINVSGNTLLALVIENDLLNSSPGTPNANEIGFQNRVAANPPILTVDYTPNTTTTSTSTSTSTTTSSSTTTRTTLTSSSTTSSSTSTSTSTSSSSSTSTSTSSTTTIVPYYIGDPIPEILIMEEI